MTEDLDVGYAETGTSIHTHTHRQTRASKLFKFVGSSQLSTATKLFGRLAKLWINETATLLLVHELTVFSFDLLVKTCVMLRMVFINVVHQSL
jgi:hypothetical protein